MTIPDPRTFFGKKCVIKLKDGTPVLKVVKTIDTTGVITDDGDGKTTTYCFKDIDRVSLAK